jgi:protein gp37
MTASKIEWTDRSDWNPIRGCTRVSPGCVNCYAEAIAGRFSGPDQPFHGYATKKGGEARWTGKVEVVWHRETLPLNWTKAARIFASSTSDFFHPGFDLIDVAELFGVMIAAHHLRGHTLQVLTKRADRMREALLREDFWEHANIAAERHVMARTDPLDRRQGDARATLDDYSPDNPPPGIWLGVSVEDQQRAAERVPDLRATPAAVRWISAEPLLGPVDLTDFADGTALDPECWGDCDCDSVFGYDPGCRSHGGDGSLTRKIDWVVCGGESGPNARPMHPDWARALRDQCAEACVPFFFKQWGSYATLFDRDHDDPDWRNCGQWEHRHPKGRWLNLAGGTGFHGDRVVYVDPVGKKAAGRLLDGREWSEFPA